MTDQTADKSALRQEASTIKAGLLSRPDFDREALCHAMYQGIAQYPGIKKDSVVAGYWPLPHELDCRPLMWSLMKEGAVIALPVIIDSKAPLQWRRFEGEAHLIAGPHNIREPAKYCAVVTPDVVLVPLMAFDGRGHRLGFGGGYYDRSLEALRADNPDLLAIGIAMDGLEIDSIPDGPYDQRLNAVVTETGWRPLDLT